MIKAKNRCHRNVTQIEALRHLKLKMILHLTLATHLLFTAKEANLPNTDTNDTENSRLQLTTYCDSSDWRIRYYNFATHSDSYAVR